MYFSHKELKNIDFDVIVMMCETFNISIQSKYIKQLIKLKSYSEDNAIYMLKCGNIKFNITNDENLAELMNAFEYMYNHAISNNFEVLAKVIRHFPYFVASLDYENIGAIIQKYPSVLAYNFNKNEILFDILHGSNNVVSIRLRDLCLDETLKDFNSTNKILYVMLLNKLTVPLDESYNKVFFNYVKKIELELQGGMIEYSPGINYSEKLLEIHLKLMGTLLVEIN